MNWNENYRIWISFGISKKIRYFGKDFLICKTIGLEIVMFEFLGWDNFRGNQKLR